ncbi:hypothetical protein Apa02nite_068860 [Actinoplanes palleronii]|uniref:Uncharacterized protein n=1 Tax=Actinoplanes palleronii TaxID=113570 RepID=A0ABQ4BJB6_9ACTN|nr:hypothetical protein Apa02nite_068860 [Actinoplanes palleronii]
MAKVTRYGRPYPKMTDRPGRGQYVCRAIHPEAGWACTRLAGHDDRHEAGNADGKMFASWPATAGERR